LAALHGGLRAIVCNLRVDAQVRCSGLITRRWRDTAARRAAHVLPLVLLRKLLLLLLLLLITEVL
jgi:hypothetical protein